MITPKKAEAKPGKPDAEESQGGAPPPVPTPGKVTAETVDGAAEESQGGAPPPVPTPRPRPAVPYTVADGKALVVTGRRILGPGDEVKEVDFPEGEARLLHLVSTGHIIDHTAP